MRGTYLVFGSGETNGDQINYLKIISEIDHYLVIKYQQKVVPQYFNFVNLKHIQKVKCS